MAGNETFSFASRLGLGTHALHRLLSSATRANLLALGYDLGLRYFDTAPSYGAGIAERELGRFAHERRSELILTTKFGIPPSRLGGTVPGWMYAAMGMRAIARAVGAHQFLTRPPARDFSAEGARASVERSLRALRTDRVDILYLHEPTIPLLGDVEPLARTMEELKASGKVLRVGLSGRESECAQITRAYPALAEVLQIEVPRGSDGLPLGGAPLQGASVRFWEFPQERRRAPQPERLAQIAARLVAAAPQGLLMLSTNVAAELRDTVASIEKFESMPAAGATAALA